MAEKVEKLEDEAVPIKIGVIGLGYVGGAIHKFFSQKGEAVAGYDKLGRVAKTDQDGSVTAICSDHFEAMYETDFVFICLPTPYIEGFGFDYTALHENLLKLAKANYGGIVIIKSTIEPGTLRLLSTKYKLAMVHNPEFLTAKTADEDFANQTHIVIGGFDFVVCQKVVGLYQKHIEAQYTLCDAEQAELMKLFCNNFYAVKVQLFNEFALTCKRMGVRFEDVKGTMLRNGWINPMHTDVPGSDGQFSYGGACFPKDTSALRDFMKRQGVPCEIIEACISERNKMRKD